MASGETAPEHPNESKESFRTSGILRAFLWLGLIHTSFSAYVAATNLFRAPTAILISLAVHAFLITYFATGLATVFVERDTIRFRFGLLQVALRGSDVQTVYFGGLLVQCALAGRFKVIPIHPWIDRYADLYRLLRTTIPQVKFGDPSGFPLSVTPSNVYRSAVFFPCFVGVALALASFPESVLIVGFVLAVPSVVAYLLARPGFQFDEDGVTIRDRFQFRRFEYSSLNEMELFQDAGFLVLGLQFGSEKVMLKGVKCSIAPERVYSLLVANLNDSHRAAFSRK